MLGAIDIGGTKIAVGLVTETGQLLDSTSIPTHPSQEYEAALAEVSVALDDLILVNHAALQGIGIGTTGRLEAGGTLQPNQFLPHWSARNPALDLSTRFGVTAAIENDADAAALAEYHWGAGHGSERLIYITISTGIGGGIILRDGPRSGAVRGKLYRGVDGCHPEMGHHVINPDGPQCFCGARGCWESLASGTALAAWARKNGGEPGWDARRVCDLAEQGHSIARLAVAREARYLGIGIANLITFFAPDCIVLGGGLMQRWELFRENVEIIIQQNCGLVPWQKTRLSPSQLQHPGLLGAAAVWIQHTGDLDDL
jgi:glucokinase